MSDFLKNIRVDSRVLFINLLVAYEYAFKLSAVPFAEFDLRIIGAVDQNQIYIYATYQQNLSKNINLIYNNYSDQNINLIWTSV